MMRKDRDRLCGQSTAEYAILIAIVVAAMVGMQTYVKRGLQAKYKDASDTLTQPVGQGTGLDLPQLSQYEPYYARSNFQVNQSQNQTETTVQGGGVQRTGVTDTTTRTEGGFQQQNADLGQDDQWR